MSMFGAKTDITNCICCCSTCPRGNSIVYERCQMHFHFGSYQDHEDLVKGPVVADNIYENPLTNCTNINKWQTLDSVSTS